MLNELDLFSAALAIPDPADRNKFLQSECQESPELRERILQLLSATARSNNPLDHPVMPGLGVEPSPTPEVSSAQDFVAGARKGTLVASRYKLIEQIGEGGMGAVWMAEQFEPIRRRVALKLIRAERGTSATILARFEAERQAIALMNHPNIALLLDAGTTESGSPFFVMELVNGKPLTHYCDEHRLTVTERLRLFKQICGAVQHAHHKGVIHRDLKPTNLLVEEQDGQPVPKVIDFGLVKATSGIQLGDQSLSTVFGSVIGTPLYMAPEQARFNAVDVDTRADVYALGVILYELLTGSTPLTRDGLQQATIEELLRMVREDEPPAPSSRVSSTEKRKAIAAERQTDPVKLRRYLRGELDWIVMKALSKERDRRYETASGFARDIDRFLTHKPVVAGPPSQLYKLRKFLRRNRPQVIAAGVVFVGLVVGIVGVSIGLLRAESRRAEAETQKKQKQAVSKVLKELLGASDLRVQFTSSRGPRTWPAEEAANQTMRDFFKQLPDRLPALQRLDSSPLVRAEIEDTFGTCLHRIGEYAKAIEHLQNAVRLREEHLGSKDPETLASRHHLGVAYHDAGELGRSLPLLTETLNTRIETLGHDHPDTWQSKSALAGGYLPGNLDESLRLLEETRDSQIAKLTPDHPEVLHTNHRIAQVHLFAGRLRESVKLFEATLLTRQDQLGPAHIDTLQNLRDLAEAYIEGGKYDLALLYLKQVTERLEKARGPEHPDTLSSKQSLARALYLAGKHRQSFELGRETLKLQRAKLPPDHPDILQGMETLASVSFELGDRNAARTLSEDCYQLTRQKYGETHRLTLTAMNNRATLRKRLSDPTRAYTELKESLRLHRLHLPADHPNTFLAMNNLAGVCKDLGQHDRAKELLEEALQRLTEKLGPTHLYTLVARNNLDELILELNLEEGISRLEATRDLLASHYPEHPFLYTCMYNVATGYFKGKRFDRSLSILENVLRLQQDHLSKDHPDTLRTKLILAANFRFVGRMDEARNLFEELVRLPEDDLHRSDRIYLNAASTLGLIYKDAGRRSEAIPLLEQGFRAWKLDPTLMTIGPVLIELYLQELPRDEAMRKIREVLQSCRDDSSQGTALATSLVGCGAKLLNSGEYLLAEELLREGQQLREKTAPDAWSTFNAKSLLGASLLGLGRYSEAEPLLKVGYEGMKSREKSIPPVARDRLPEAARRLVDLYDLTGNEPELRHWRSIWRTYCEPLAAPRELR